MNTVETSAGPIACDVRGSGDAIVLLPGGAHTQADFDELRARLPGFRTISLDWPAHGASPPGAGSASVSSFADAAEEVVAALAPEGAVVLGNSVGGFAAGRMAIRRPDLLRGLVIVDGGGFGGFPLRDRMFCSLMSRRRFLRAIYPAFSAAYMRARTEADRAARRRAIATTREDPGLGTVAELWASFARPEHDLREGAPSIAAPALLLWGRRDPVIPVGIAQRAAELIPGARLVVLESGHLPHTTDPDAVAAELVPFTEVAFAYVAAIGDSNGPSTVGGGRSDPSRVARNAREESGPSV